ncbi:hypothetical protein [Nonomuraea sp. NPDC049028]|uniref:hypothetical protein n=1 Tax=Nonomuraea sp. NPDC049028 TaxID=3364348 RepID=UPI0037126B35
MAIDYSTDVGRVRLLIPDTDADNLLLIDPQIDALLSMEGSVKLAAATALELIASNEALVGKVITTQDLSTDGTKVAAELRARAAALRQQVDDGVGDDNVGLGIVDFDPWLGYRGYTPC